MQYFREQLQLFICISYISVPKYIGISFMLEQSTEFPAVVMFDLGEATRALE